MRRDRSPRSWRELLNPKIAFPVRQNSAKAAVKLGRSPPQPERISGGQGMDGFSPNGVQHERGLRRQGDAAFNRDDDEIRMTLAEANGFFGNCHQIGIVVDKYRHGEFFG